MRYRLDTSGLRCPLPVRLTARRIARLRVGDQLEVIGDDPAMGLDLEAWCFDSGHHLLERGGEPPDAGPLYCRIEVREGRDSAKDPASDDNVVALLPAAGHARRLGVVEGSKEILPLEPSREGARTSTLERLLDGLDEAGIERALIVLRAGKWDIPAQLARRRAGPAIAFAVINSSRNVPETLCAGLDFLGDSKVLLAFPDILYDPPEIFAEVVKEQAKGADLVLGLVPTDRPDKSDMVELDAEGRPIDIVIKSDRTDLDWAWGFAAWGPRFSELLRSTVRASSSSDTVASAGEEQAGELPTGEELFVGDVVRRAIALGFDVRAVSFPQALFLDIGTPEDLERARGRLKASDP